MPSSLLESCLPFTSQKYRLLLIARMGNVGILVSVVTFGSSLVVRVSSVQTVTRMRQVGCDILTPVVTELHTVKARKKGPKGWVCEVLFQVIESSRRNGSVSA